MSVDSYSAGCCYFRKSHAIPDRPPQSNLSVIVPDQLGYLSSSYRVCGTLVQHSLNNPMAWQARGCARKTDDCGGLKSELAGRYFRRTYRRAPRGFLANARVARRIVPSPTPNSFAILAQRRAAGIRAGRRGLTVKNKYRTSKRGNGCNKIAKSCCLRLGSFRGDDPDVSDIVAFLE